jgi:endonuclease YncB( thermonuclease family)
LTRRLSAPIVTVAAILLVSVFVACGSPGAIGTNELDGPGPPRTVITCDDCQIVDVVEVIDGDTLVLKFGVLESGGIDSGPVRVYGIDAPETAEECYAEAKAALTGLAGGRVRLEDGSRATDPFGRILAYLFDINGNSIDVQMVSAGLARAWTEDGQHRDTLMALERSARSNRAGCLWGQQ